MSRRLVLLALAVAAGGVLAAAPAHAESVCVTHDLRPTVDAAGVFCVDTNDSNFIRCGGTLLGGHYFCS